MRRLPALLVSAVLAVSTPAFAEELAVPASHPHAAVFESLLSEVENFDRQTVPPHPRLLLTPPELERVRTASRSNWGKPLFEAVRHHVEQQRSKAIPAEPAGFTDDTWNITDWRRIVDAGGVAQNNILASAFVAALTEDPDDIAEAKRWALGIATWNPHGPTGIEGVDHPARDILHALSLSYDWLYDEWTDEERDVLRRCIVERGRAMYKHLNPFTGDPANNHGWFQASALVEAGLALADEVPEADAWWRYGSRLYFTTFLPLGGRDGDWHEGTHYVSYTMIFVYQWVDALRSATGIEAGEVPWLQRVGHFRLYVAPPQGAGIHFNDNNIKPPNSWDKMTAYAAARDAQDPVLQWYADTIHVGSWTNPLSALYSLIYRDPALSSQPPTPDTPLGRWFRDSGWAVFRTDLSTADDVQFGFKGAPYQGTAESRGHDHPDQNGFLLNYLGESLLVDSGYYDYYGSPHHNGWTFTGRAHNTLLVDDQEQPVGEDGQIVSFIDHNGGLGAIEGEAAQAYPEGLLNSWRRQVLFLRPNTFVIRDIVEPTKSSVLTWLLHGPTQFELTEDGQSFSVRNGKAMASGTIFSTAELTADQWSGFPADAQPERKKPEDYPDQWHVTFETSGKVGHTETITTIHVGRSGAPPHRPKATRNRVGTGEQILISGDAPTMLLVNSGDEPLDAPEYATQVDARLYAIRGTAEGASDVLMLGGRELRHRQELLFESEQRMDLSGQRTSDGWRELTIRLDTPSRVRLFSARRPAAVLHSNAPEPDWSYDTGTRMVSFHLKPGIHTLRVESP